MSVKDLGWVRRRGFSSCFLSGCRRKQRKEAQTASLSHCDTRKVNSESFLLWQRSRCEWNSSRINWHPAICCMQRANPARPGPARLGAWQSSMRAAGNLCPYGSDYDLLGNDSYSTYDRIEKSCCGQTENCHAWCRCCSGSVSSLSKPGSALTICC